MVYFSILVILFYIVCSEGKSIACLLLISLSTRRFCQEKKHLHLDKAAESTLQFWLNTGSMPEISIALKQCKQRRPGFRSSSLNCIPHVPAQHPKKGKTVAAISCAFQHGLHTIKYTDVFPKSLSSPVLIWPLLRYPLNLQSVPGGPGFVFIRT